MRSAARGAAERAVARALRGAPRLVLASTLACAGAAGEAAPPMPARDVRIVPHAHLTPMERAPYDQPFAWVEPSRIFAGLFPRDDVVTDPRLHAALKRSVQFPLEALGWYEVPEDRARFFVTVLLADRTILQPAPQAPASLGGPGRRPQEAGAMIPVGRTYRAYAISSRSGATHFRVMESDRWTVEAAFGADVIRLVMGAEP